MVILKNDRPQRLTLGDDKRAASMRAGRRSRGIESTTANTQSSLIAAPQR
jgi:hypothetical protein